MRYEIFKTDDQFKYENYPCDLKTRLQKQTFSKITNEKFIELITPQSAW